MYLSSKPTLDGTAELLRSYDGNSQRPLLAPGAAQKVPLPLAIPYDGLHPSGTYYFIVQTDFNGVIPEADNAVTLAVSAPIQVVDNSPPSVTAFVPAGVLNANVSSFQVTFNKPMAAATFTPARVSIIGPGGALDPSTLTITAVTTSTFTVAFPSQSAEGAYAISLATGITDLSGNGLLIPYQTSFTIDKAGPRIIATTPTGTVNGAVASINVTFSKAINPLTFTTSSIQLTDTHGQPLTVRRPSLVSGNTYAFTFASQDANGTYNLAIGPNIDDVAGNPMDQNQDGINGDATLDVFHGSFAISLPALVVDTLVPSAASAVFGDPFNLTWTVHNAGSAPCL